MTDIVERLREWPSNHDDAVEAADEIERLRKENELLRLGWRDDDEAIKQQALRVLPKEVVEGDSVHAPRMGELAEMMADEIMRHKIWEYYHSN